MYTPVSEINPLAFPNLSTKNLIKYINLSFDKILKLHKLLNDYLNLYYYNLIGLFQFFHEEKLTIYKYSSFEWIRISHYVSIIFKKNTKYFIVLI